MRRVRALLVDRSGSGASTSSLVVAVGGRAVRQVTGAGGRVAVAHSDCQADAHSQCLGMWSTIRRPVDAIWAGTLIMRVRRVAQRALACPAATAVARAMLNAITAWASQAAFAA